MSGLSPTEKKFETHIEDHLKSVGYTSTHSSQYDRNRCLINDQVIDFIQTTQPQKWEQLTQEAMQSPAVGVCLFLGPTFHFLDSQRLSFTARWVQKISKISSTIHGTYARRVCSRGIPLCFWYNNRKNSLLFLAILDKFIKVMDYLAHVL